MAGRFRIDLGDIVGGLRDGARNLFTRQSDAERYEGNPYYQPKEETVDRTDREDREDREDRGSDRERSFVGPRDARSLHADLEAQHDGKANADGVKDSTRLNRAAETLESFGITAAAGLKDKTLTTEQGERLHEAVKEAGDWGRMSKNEKETLNNTVAEITGAKQPTPVAKTVEKAKEEAEEKDDPKSFLRAGDIKSLRGDLAAQHDGKATVDGVKDSTRLNNAIETLGKYGVDASDLKDKTLTTDQGQKLHDAVKAVADWGRISNAERGQLNEAVSGIAANDAGQKQAAGVAEGKG